MNSEIKAIINDLGNYVSNDKPQIDEHNIIIPYSLHYTDANLLFSYICELEEENKKLVITNCKYLQQRIDKAIEYMEQWRDTKTKRMDSRLKRTLEILKGEE